MLEWNTTYVAESPSHLITQIVIPVYDRETDSWHDGTCDHRPPNSPRFRITIEDDEA